MGVRRRLPTTEAPEDSRPFTVPNDNLEAAYNDQLAGKDIYLYSNSGQKWWLGSSTITYDDDGTGVMVASGFTVHCLTGKSADGLQQNHCSKWFEFKDDAARAAEEIVLKV